MIIVALCQGVVKFKGVVCVNCGIYRPNYPQPLKGCPVITESISDSGIPAPHTWLLLSCRQDTPQGPGATGLGVLKGEGPPG